MAEDIRLERRPHDGRASSLGELIHVAVRRTIEAAVDEELTAALGARPHERDGQRRGLPEPPPSYCPCSSSIRRTVRPASSQIPALRREHRRSAA